MVLRFGSVWCFRWGRRHLSLRRSHNQKLHVFFLFFLFCFLSSLLFLIWKLTGEDELHPKLSLYFFVFVFIVSVSAIYLVD